MAEERRRRKSLTPLESELRQPPADWTPPGPVAEAYRPRKPAAPPTTTRGMFLQGARRLLFLVGGIAAAIAIVGVLLVYLADANADSTFPVLFYIVGALVAGGGLWSVFGHEWAPETGYEQLEKESWVGDVFAYFGVGLTVIALGVALEVLL